MAEKNKKKTRRVPAWKKRELRNQHRIERRSAITTGLIFLGLFVAFVFISLKSPVQKPEEKGINVVLGEHDFGMSQKLKQVKESTDVKEKAEKLKTKKAEKAEQTKTSESAKSTSDKPTEQKSITQDKEEAPQMSEKKKSEEQSKADKTEEADQKDAKPEDKKTTQKEERKPDPKNLFTPSDDSKGDDEKPGNKGEKTGDKDVKNTEKKEGEAEEKAKGISHNLGNREIVKYPTIKDPTQKTGKVVIEIIVNRQGEVIDAKYEPRNSTVTDLRLINLARKAALDTKFDPSPQGRQREFGKMTFNFKLQ